MSSRRISTAAAAIVLLSMVLRSIDLDPTLTDHDTWRQTDTASIARNFVQDPRILWPRVDWGAPGPGFVEAEFQLYTFAVSLIYRIAGSENPAYARLLSVLLFGVAAWFFFRLARRYLSASSALTAVGVFALTPVVFRYTRVVMPEATVLLFYLLALERFVVFLSDGGWKPLLISAAAMALAILVKPTSIHLGLVLIALVLQRQGWRQLLRPPLLSFAGIALVPAVAYYWHAAQIHLAYGNTFGVISGGDPKWGSPMLWFSARFWGELLFMDTMWMTGPIGSVLVIFGLRGQARELKQLAWPWLATLWLYYLITGRYSGCTGAGLHYHIYAAPLYALLAALGWEHALTLLPRLGAAAERRKPLLKATLLAAVLLYQLALCVIVIAKPHHTQTLTAGRALQARSDPGDVVVVLSWDNRRSGNVTNNFQQPDVFFHARRKGRSLGHDDQNASGLRRALADDARWFVNFPELNGAADESFFAELHIRARLAHKGEAFEIWAVTRT